MKISKSKYDRSYKAIGLKIRSLREKRGWTLEDTEEHGWHSWSQLQKIESGRNITVKTLITLADVFGVHPSELLADI